MPLWGSCTCVELSQIGQLVLGMAEAHHLHLVVCKCVDDSYYGIQKEGIRTPATQWMEIVFGAFGLQLDGRTSEAFSKYLVILASKIVVIWMKRGVRLALSEEQIKRWSLDVLMALDTMVLTPATTEKSIGRLGWTAGLSIGKIGRTYTKALWAQCEDLMHGNRVSDWLQLPLKWWLSFFKLQSGMWRTNRTSCGGIKSRGLMHVVPHVSSRQ